MEDALRQPACDLLVPAWSWEGSDTRALAQHRGGKHRWSGPPPCLGCLAGSPQESPAPGTLPVSISIDED